MGFISIVVLLGLLYAAASLRVLRQYERGVVFLLGRFAGEHDGGNLHREEFHHHLPGAIHDDRAGGDFDVVEGFVSK